jgi:thymidylate synthase (FAD)
MKVSSVAVTKSLILDPNEGIPLTPDELIVYEARVSNPNNQHNHETGPKLLHFCMREGHWSVFDQADLTVEIETSISISMQILRHWSARFQQFSQRYADVRKLETIIEPITLRMKAAGGNRQGSGDDVKESDWRTRLFNSSITTSVDAYITLVEAGVAPESARFVLPLCTKTRMFMKGSARTWIHYLDQRTSPHAQKEHREVAEAIRAEFAKHFPTVHEAMGLRVSEVQSLKNEIERLKQELNNLKKGTAE